MPGEHRKMIGAALAALMCAMSAQANDASTDAAATVLQASGTTGGLIVHLNSGNGELTASLCTNDRTIVQGLEADPAKVASARDHIQSLGKYGKVSVRCWDQNWLPYGDNLINLLVVSPGACKVADDEIQRVLRPGGSVISLQADPSKLKPIVKPRPSDIDDWTHYLHDAGNNAVAEDTRVGPPKHMQWKSGPMWSRSHEFSASVQALVSDNGRLIGIYDEGIIGQPRGVPEFWTLLARDAFNGILLWRRPCARVHAHALAVVDDRVYVTLASKGPMSILDAATGETLQICEATGKVNELAVIDGKVILNTTLADESGKPSPHIAAADPMDGHLLWQTPVESVASNTMVVGGGRVCYFNGADLVCLSQDDGRELWRSDARGRGKGYAVLYKNIVCVTGGSTRAFSLETGELLWTGPDGNPHARNPPGLFGAKDLIWTAWSDGDPRSFLWQHRAETRDGYDLLTGEVKKTITAERLVTAGHHIRCYPGKATSRYLLLNKRGVEFFDLEGTNHMRANWTRGTCGFGMLPANGLLYAPPAQCFCYQGVLLSGLNALAASREDSPSTSDARPRLEKGPAFGKISSASSASDNKSDWPTYRHDVLRSNSFPAELPTDLKRVWTATLCPPAYPKPESTVDSADEDRLILKGSDATIHGDGARQSGDAVIAWRGKDTSISWKTNIEQSGKLPVWIRQANSGESGSVFELAVGSEKLTGTIRHTRGWEDYIWLRVGDVNLPAAGEYTVTVTPVKQSDGRLGNVAAIALGGDTPPAGVAGRPKLRARPQHELTPPVAADGRVFLAASDSHTVFAIDAKDGSRLWSFVADGRVDSPPTIYQGRCLFGCTDGYVYCLSAADGQLVWRFRAAPEERQICVMGQVESAWPVHGSVLVRDDMVYATAGRSSYLDGGITIFALDPRSGEVLYETPIHSEDPDVTVDGGRPFDMEGSRSDILVAGQKDIYLFQNRFDSSLTPQPMPRITKLGDRRGEPHLMTTDGFLDKTWFNRTYWTYSDRWPGYYFTYRGPKSGQMIAFDDQHTYALKVYTSRVGHSPEFTPGGGYQLIADRNTTEPVLDEMDIGAEKGRGYTRTELPVWNESLPIRSHGMVLAKDRLYVAGPPDLSPEEGAYEAMIGQRGAVFRVVSTEDGSSLSEFKMDEVPVFDGLIAAGDRLFMTTMDGTLICFGAGQE